MRRVARWLQEPLVHFAILGAALFALYHWVAPQRNTRSIVLSDSVVRGLRQDYLRRTGALPTALEEVAILQRYIDDEVMYREALALGLDRGDIIVRRRLLQKMEFLSESVEPIPEPTDDELVAYIAAHADRYAVPARVTMTHVFASADRHPENVESFAAQLYAQLTAGADPSLLGDPFLRGRELVASSERDIAAVFGPAFAAQVMTMPIGSWEQPLRSSYGLHVVRVSQRSAGHSAGLEDVRAAARHDWQEGRRAEATRAVSARLRERYDIRVETEPHGALAAELPPSRSDPEER